MPSARPCAAFEPISPDFDVAALVESTPNFEYVVRIHCDMIDHQGIENFEKLVLLHVIMGGKPLVIEGYQDRLDRWTFALQWLRDNCASKVENARDLTKKANLPLSIGHYLNNMALLTNQWNSTNYKDPERQRIYLKDIDCPQLWHDKLKDLVPLGLFYLNESSGEIGGLGAVDEANPHGPGMRKGRGIAKAGDLMSSLPPEMRAENMMCYIGHEGTYTPAHREMCASLGQNIMVETSTGLMEDGKPTKPGSSIWFMTESKEREVVSEYWLSTLGHDIEVENHFAQINAWKAAPFKTYVVEQRVGDFILIPPLAPHQVWNRGTRTMKVAWNRTTVETLEMALNEALPRARMVCRDEQYKNKAIVYYSLMKYSRLLRSAEKLKQKRHNAKQHSKDSLDAKIRQLEKDFRRLQALFTQVMLSESFFPDQDERKIELIPFDSNITCSYCRCNIFNRFLTCPSCIGELPNGDDDTYDICMECYAMGRSCACISKLKWVEQFSWGELVQKHEQWRHQIIQFEGQITDKSPKSLKAEMNKLGKQRTLAQICQDELKKRPWRDIKKPLPPVEGEDKEEEVEVDANGNLKKKRKVRRSEKFKREHKACHVDKSWEPKWKQSECSQCGYSFCYGTLFRGYDMMPQDIMADPDWKCPKCLNICSCRDCRKKPGWKPFTPSGTMLGHDTKKIADPRSVESLVDFSFSNLSWIQKAGDDHPLETRRLKKRRKAAEEAKAKGDQLGEDYVEDTATPAEENDDVEDGILRLAQQEGIPIDPALGKPNGPVQLDIDSQDEDERYNENPEEVGTTSEYSSNRPPAPQYVVPAGGVIRDADHAYDATEAITYDYPDPDIGVHVPVAAEPEEQAEQAPPGYEAAVPPASPGQIAMTNRKRKRIAKPDEGERPYTYKKGDLERRKKKPRKSLIVKLTVDKEKLTELNKMAIIAQHALNGVAQEEAPVISSDLRALNTTWDNTEGQAPTKKARVEHILEEVDDEFTPSRRRDRRKSAQNPEAVPGRRTTRMQTVTYEDLIDEEDFDDELVETTGKAPRDHAKSKWLAMRQGSDVSDSQSEGPSRPGTSSGEGDIDGMDVDEDDGAATRAPQKRPAKGALTIRRFSDLNRDGAEDEEDAAFDNDLDAVNEGLALEQTAPKAHAQPSKTDVIGNGTAKLPLTKGAPTPSTAQSKAIIAGAVANRKAKLAAAQEYLDDDSGSERSNDWSRSGRGSDSSALKSASDTQQRSNKERQSLPNPTKTINQRGIEQIRPAAAQKASTADWGNSDSDSDTGVAPIAQIPKQASAQPSWSSINKPHISILKPMVAAKRKGRVSSGL